MSKNDDSDFDLNAGDIDECTQVRVQPSIQAAGLFNLNHMNTKKTENCSNNLNTVSFHAQSASCLTQTSSRPTESSKNYSSEITDFNKPHKVSSEKTTKRLYEFQSKVEEKVKNMIKEKEENEMEECSFRPSILNNTKRRNIQTFLTQMQKYSDIKKKKIENFYNG